MSEGRSGLIWTLQPAAAEAVAKLDDAAFLARLQHEFGFRLGRFTRVGARQLYPLSLTRSDEHVGPRLAVVGNAAQALHPIAGQGFNLGLRDAASLAEVIADARAQSSDSFDVGDGLLLERYRNLYVQFPGSGTLPKPQADASPTIANVDFGLMDGGTRKYEWKLSPVLSKTDGAKTVLVSASGKSSPAIYALDITQPGTTGYPLPLWEFMEVEVTPLAQHPSDLAARP